MASSKTFLLVKLCLSLLYVLGNASEENHDAPLRCDLVCANGGYCTLSRGEPDELAKSAQSGRLIEVCVCQPGFTGVACEIAVEQCDNSEHTCHNGLPCELDPNDGLYHCNCAKADDLSVFAGRMCRQPVTEYCSGRFRPDSDLSFCTNGGRCKADFIGARIAPGDTSVNRAYQHAGCICPPEFYGPHCEFLKLDDNAEEYEEFIEVTKVLPQQTQKKTGYIFPLAGIMLGIALVFMSVVAFAIVRQKYNTVNPAGFVDEGELDFPNHGDWTGQNQYPAYHDEGTSEMYLDPYLDIAPPREIRSGFEPTTSY